MTSIDFPARLADDLVALRPIEDRDVATYAHAFRADRELGRRLGMSRDPDEEWCREAPKRSWEAARDGRQIELAISDADGDELLGALLLKDFAWPHRRCELAYWLVPGARGRGLATAAVSLVVNWLFAELGFERVEIAATTENGASQGVSRRAGFTQEALQRQRDFERGRRVDVLRFGLLQDEWPGPRS